MNLKRHFGEAATLVAAAVLCALVANALARSERKLPLFGNYPNATKVPEKKAESTPPDPAAPTRSEPPVSWPPTPAAAATAPTPLAATAVTPAAAKPPKSPGAAPAPAPAGEQKESLLQRFPAHGKPYVEVSGDDAAWLVARGALAIDARRTKDYEAGHVAGARNISPWEGDADAKITALVNEGRDGAIPVLLYCSGGDCEDSHMLAQRGGKVEKGPEPAR
jgi:rhodanese-related sulfurtransferase